MSIEATAHRATAIVRAVASGVSWHAAVYAPRVFPLFLVTGFPKSGTTWVSHLFSELLNLPYPRKSMIPILYASIYHGHQMPTGRNRWGVYVMRDGRDAMTSFYFHLMRFVPEGDHPHLALWQRRIFPGLVNKHDTQVNFPRFLERQMAFPVATKTHWGGHVERYLDCCCNTLPLIRYEDLKRNAVPSLRGALASLGAPDAGTATIESAVEKYDFSRQAGRKAGQEVEGNALRKGVVGDWRKYFDRQAAEIFDFYCGDALIAAGYEKDRSWVFDVGH